MLLPVTQRHQHGHWLANSLGFGVAEDSFGPPVPAHNIPRAINRNNGITGRLGNCPQTCLAFGQRRCSPVAILLASKVIQRKADVQRHFDQQGAYAFIEGIGFPAIQVETANGDTVTLQRQRGRGSPAG